MKNGVINTSTYFSVSAITWAALEEKLLGDGWIREEVQGIVYYSKAVPKMKVQKNK